MDAEEDVEMILISARCLVAHVFDADEI